MRRFFWIPGHGLGTWYRGDRTRYLVPGGHVDGLARFARGVVRGRRYAQAPRQDIVKADHVYHVIVRGNNKAAVFLDEHDYGRYSELLLDAKRRFGASLFHFVLMPNHVHLIIRPGHQGLSALMHAVQLPFAKHFCRKYHHVGHVWQGRFKSLAIESDAYLLACGNYVEMNPVRASIATKPEDWPHSSYRAYAFGQPLALVDQDPLYEGIAALPEDRQRRYRELLVITRSF